MRFAVGVSAMGIAMVICTKADASFVQSIGTLQNLRSGVATANDNVNVRGYAADGDGGGGQFVKSGSSCSDDDGTVIYDSAHSECWYRQFSGPVDMRWFGLGASITADIITQFGRAFAASETNRGNRTVITGGSPVALTGTGDLNIPTGDTLDCQGTIGGISGSGLTIPTLKSSIIVTPPTAIAATTRSTLENCNIRPSWFTTGTLTDSTRALINIIR